MKDILDRFSANNAGRGMNTMPVATTGLTETYGMSTEALYSISDEPSGRLILDLLLT